MNRWFFWVLAPFMLATGLGLPFMAEPPTWQGRVVLHLVCGILVLVSHPRNEIGSGTLLDGDLLRPDDGASAHWRTILV